MKKTIITCILAFLLGIYVGRATKQNSDIEQTIEQAIVNGQTVVTERLVITPSARWSANEPITYIWRRQWVR